MASPRSILVAILAAIACALCISSLVKAQDCGCDPSLCCSQSGYCGSTDEFCGDGCQEGPCNSSTDDTPTDPDDTPTDPNDTPTDPDDTPTDPDDTPTDPDDTPTDPDDTPTDPDDTPTDPDDTPTDPDDTPTDPDDTPTPTDPDDSPIPAAPSGISISDVVSDDFFDGIIGQAGSSCEGKDFYSRSAFLDSVNNYPEFASAGSSDDNLREIAAFFAHVTRETGHFCYIEEIRKATYCQASSQWPCKPNKQYYGRGPLQITWNYNYGPAGQSIGFDGLNAPETVANDPGVSFSTALWFWMKNVHSLIVSGQGFGSTIRAINGGECNGRKPAAVKARVEYYTDYCSQLGVDPGNNISC